MRRSRRRNTLQKVNRNVLLSTFEWLQALIVALVVVTLLLTFAVRVVGVFGDSMLPTLEHGDRLLLTSLSGEYERGDIVVIDRYTDEPLIKRVIGVAGDVIEITEGCQLFVNGALQEEDYITGLTVPRDMTGPVSVPVGHIFVLGDNRSVSKDSRQTEIGLVSLKDVVGKVLYRLLPMGSAGPVYD